MNISFDTLIILFVIALALIALAVAAWTLINRRRAWEELATSLGMHFDPGNLFGSGMSVSGTYRGHQLTLDKFTQHRGRYSVSFTRIVLVLNQPADLSLAIYQETLLRRIGKSLGQPDIQTGDDALDRRFIIQGQPEAEVSRLLSNANLRQRLLDARSVDLRLEGRQIYFRKRRVETDPERLMALFNLVSDLADVVDRLRF